MKQVEGNTTRVRGAIGGRRQLVLPEDTEDKPKTAVCRILSQWVEFWGDGARSGGPVLIRTIQERIFFHSRTRHLCYFALRGIVML